MIAVPRLAVAVSLVVAGCGVGIVATTLLNPSPQQAAQSRQAPSLAAPTAVVTKQVLAQYVQGACTTTSVERQLRPPTLPAGRRYVVTTLDAGPGKRIKPGTLLLSVSDQPLVAYVSSVPFFRSLKQGDTGSDVKALERGLVAAKLLHTADNTLGADTAAVLARLNTAAGHPFRGIDLHHSVAVPAGSSVSSVPVAVGQVIGPHTVVLIVGSGTNQATCSVPASARVSTGTTLSLTDTDGAFKVRVVGITTSKDDPTQAEVTVEAAKPIPDGAQLKIPDGSATAPTLTVPAGAIAVSPSGTSVVRKITAGGTEDVEVKVGTSAGGWVQVSAAGLVAGDTVELQAAAKQ